MTQTKKTTKPPLMIGDETFGQRLSRLRKRKGYTQVELAKKMEIVQVLISDYERDKLRPYHDVVIKFALALEISADELLGLKDSKTNDHQPSLKIMRRLQKIEELPPSQQRALFQTIDTFLKGAEK